MSSGDWINEIDSIIRNNVESIGGIFNEIKSQVVCTPFNPNQIIDQLNASERL